jgi:hypothetical protein
MLLYYSLITKPMPYLYLLRTRHHGIDYLVLQWLPSHNEMTDYQLEFVN